MPAGSKASKKIALSRADAETLILSQVLRDYDLLPVQTWRRQGGDL